LKGQKGKGEWVHFLLKRRTTMTHKTYTALSLSFFLLFVISVSIAEAQSGNLQETLKQYISDLQKNPNDYPLREKIIRLVQEMKPAPAVPEEAERYMARGTAAVKSAKDANDFKDAVQEFEKATLAAPWLANAYYNLGFAQDKAGLYADAIKSLKLYLLAAPNASDTKEVKSLIYEIEYRQEKAAKESSPEAIAAKKQKEYDKWLRKLDGAKYVYRFSTNEVIGMFYFEISGKTVMHSGITTWCADRLRQDKFYRPCRQYNVPFDMGGTYAINGYRFTQPKATIYKEIETDLVSTISEDGNTITQS
jgi:tetratricopeptide (TPR) repeat protein